NMRRGGGPTVARLVARIAPAAVAAEALEEGVFGVNFAGCAERLNCPGRRRKKSEQVTRRTLLRNSRIGWGLCPHSVTRCIEESLAATAEQEQDSVQGPQAREAKPRSKFESVHVSLDPR